jgi:acetyltransferase
MEAEVAVVVTDAYQGMGLGTELVRRLVEVARDEGLARIVAKILPENEAMLALARHLNFRFESSFEMDTLNAILDLQQVSSLRSTEPLLTK